MKKNGGQSSFFLLSPEFQKLIDSEDRVKRLLKESHFVSCGLDGEKEFDDLDGRTAFERWTRQRRFIADAINKDGSILDYGCANGLLLRCLQEWSRHKLDVYGLDINKKLIKRAKELFPARKNCFVVLSETQLDRDFPRSFDIIYWNVWDDYDFEKKDQKKLLNQLLKITNKGGRLILGFYGGEERNNRVVQKIKQLGYKFSGRRKNPKGKEQLVVWFDK